jgi:hypothetical protein
MSDEQPRSSGGGAAFVLLIAFGFVVMFRWIFAIIIAVLLLAGLAWYACCRLDARDAARAAIADRADRPARADPGRRPARHVRAVRTVSGPIAGAAAN